MHCETVASPPADRVDQLLSALIEEDFDDALLLARNAPPETLAACDRQGQTALHHAVRLRQYDIAKVILERMPSLAGAYTYADGKPSHWTCLHVLADAPCGSAEAERHTTEMCKLLLRHTERRTINGKNTKGATALMLAASRGHRDVVVELIAARADLNLRDNSENGGPIQYMSGIDCFRSTLQYTVQ